MEKQHTKEEVGDNQQNTQSPLIGLYEDAGFTVDDSRELLASTSAT